MKEFLAIGEICKPHGIKGELKVFSLTDNNERFKEIDNVIINNEEYKIEGCKFQADRVILKFDKVNSIEEAEKLRKKQIFIKREQGIELSEDSYYIADILDCKVYDNDSIYIGKVEDVIETGSNDVYITRNDNKEELLIPAIQRVVKKVDIENNEIIILPVKEWM